MRSYPPKVHEGYPINVDSQPLVKDRRRISSCNLHTNQPILFTFQLTMAAVITLIDDGHISATTGNAEPPPDTTVRYTLQLPSGISGGSGAQELTSPCLIYSPASNCHPRCPSSPTFHRHGAGIDASYPHPTPPNVVHTHRPSTGAVEVMPLQ